MRGLIIIAHGSKKEISNEEFIKMVENIKIKDKSYDLIDGSFLELASPSFEESIIKMVKKGVDKIFIYPFFLNSGKHVKVDIPNIIDRFTNEYSNISFTTLEHFGKSRYIEDIILKDIS